jgi:hypothetical protein
VSLGDEDINIMCNKKHLKFVSVLQEVVGIPDGNL